MAIRRKSGGGIEIPGGVITLEPHKMRPPRGWRRRTLYVLVKILQLTIAVYGPRTTLDPPRDVTIWNTDRTRILYKEGPYTAVAGAESAIEQIRAEVDRVGLESYLYSNKSPLR